MDFFETINKRYSVRGFKDKKVEKEKLNQILEAGRRAPTGVNYQPIKIFVIDTEKNKELLKEIYPQPWFVEAPLVICVVASHKEAWTRPWDGKNIAEIDASIVMDHMILAATALGLGTCYIAAFKPYAALKLFDYDETLEPILFTPLGYPNAEPSERNNVRKNLTDLVIYK